MLSIFFSLTFRYGLTLVLKYFSRILLERGQWRHWEVITHFTTTFIGTKRHTPYSKMAANKLFFCLHVY